jgi:hypothetical protein
MKKLLTLIAIFVGVSVLTVAIAGQSPLASYVANNILGYASPMNLDSTGQLLGSQGNLATNNISGASAVVKAGTSRIVSVNVITASGVGAVYDSATVAAGAAANKVFTIPATVGHYDIDWPMTSGIVVDPSGSTIAVKYN